MFLNVQYARAEKRGVVMEKNMWEKPQMVVLTRGKPEEAVLAACKDSHASSGPSNVDSACITDFCGETLCQTKSAS